MSVGTRHELPRPTHLPTTRERFQGYDSRGNAEESADGKGPGKDPEKLADGLEQRLGIEAVLRQLAVHLHRPATQHSFFD